MLILHVRQQQSELRLYLDVKQLVEQDLVPFLRSPVDQVIPGVRRPSDPAPLDRSVREAGNWRSRRIRRRLASGEGPCPHVADHHGPAQRHAPQAPAVALAQRLGFFEKCLGALLINLCIRRPRVAYDAAHQDRYPKRSYSHDHATDSAASYL